MPAEPHITTSARGTAFIGESMVDLLRFRAALQGTDRAYTFLRDGESESAMLSWAALDRRSRAVAAHLQGCLSAGARVLLLYPPGLEFVAAFYGCLYAGVVAVPVPPPQPGRSNRGFSRLLAIARDAEPAAVLTTRDILGRWPRDTARAARGESRRSSLPFPSILTDEIPDELAEAWRDPAVDRRTLACVQYTSGSTAEPKGVMVSHGNLLHNLAYAFRLAGSAAASVSVSWLPVTHDMGLIDGVLQPAFSGCPAYLMSPAAFLQRPARWLAAITRYGATRSGGPNFAYDLCVRKVGPEERATLDLSTWHNAYNGAEPIRADTLAAFAAKFAGCGFRPSAFRPCYGLAEATLVVASARWDGDATSQVSCGRPAFGTRVVIVDLETGRLSPAGLVGEIWVSSPSVALGYWNRPDDTARTFQARTPDDAGPFLRTGDLGFIRHGELVVTGRLKDLLIVRGFKHFPQDLEHTAERQHPSVRPGSTAAFAVTSDVHGYRILLVAEVDLRKLRGADTADGVIAAIRGAIAESHGVQLHGVVLVAPGAIPKTTSGKLQRFACRQALIAETMPVLARSDSMPANA